MIKLKATQSLLPLLLVASGFSVGSADPVFNTLAEVPVGNAFYKDIVLNIVHEELWPNAPIAFVGCVAPAIADLDGDGVNDLITGVMDGGTVLFMKNEGTNAAPHYAEPRFLYQGPGDSTLLCMPPT